MRSRARGGEEVLLILYYRTPSKSSDRSFLWYFATPRALDKKLALQADQMSCSEAPRIIGLSPVDLTFVQTLFDAMSCSGNSPIVSGRLRLYQFLLYSVVIPTGLSIGCIGGFWLGRRSNKFEWKGPQNIYFVTFVFTFVNITIYKITLELDITTRLSKQNAFMGLKL